MNRQLETPKPASEIDRWDADTGNWAGHICGLPFGDFEMTPEEG
jgi:hypothetical protein